MNEVEGVLLSLRECSRETTQKFHLDLVKYTNFNNERFNLRMPKTPPCKEALLNSEVKKIIASSNCLKTPGPSVPGRNASVSAFTPFVADSESERAISNVSPIPGFSNN